ncbi:MAG: LytR/AlgR family response regulator transcription factor [Aminipila sp.]
MISIAVCDDNTIECLSISNKIHDFLLQTGVEHTILEFFDGAELLESNNSFDIVFLDIKMKKMNGLKTAELLRKKIKHFILVFVTSYQEYVYQAFDVEAFNYILKPINNNKLAKTLERAIAKNANQRDNFIIINKNREIIKINLADVIYFEIQGRVINVHYNNIIVQYYERLNTLEQKLYGQHFFRCHKSYLINLQYVEKFNKTEISMDNGDTVLLSKRRYDEFSKKFLSYMKKEGGMI